MKTKITVDDKNNVTVERDDPFIGERTSTTYFVAAHLDGSPGYVCINDGGHRYPQVCRRLAFTGYALKATPETLPAVIRRELRRLSAWEHRELSRV